MLVEPLRTAVSAEMAKSGHALHPAICRSDEPELGVVVAACGGHREARCENEHSCRQIEMQPPARAPRHNQNRCYLSYISRNEILTFLVLFTWRPF